MDAYNTFKEWQAKGVVTPLDDCEVGKTYNVLCIWGKLNNRGWYPVIPFLHRDKDFFNLDHYHNETRFLSEEKRISLNCDNRTASVIDPDNKVRFGKMAVRRMKCVSSEIGGLPLVAAGKRSLMHPWFEKMEGKPCKGKRCPHQGSNMVDRGHGLLECPLHGLFGDAKTERIISRDKAIKKLQKLATV